MKQDYYSILGIPITANEETIRLAYKTLAKQFHPDLAPPDKKIEFEEKMKEVNVAYDTLSDPKKKELYDNPAPQYRHQPHPHFNGGDINEMLRNFMSQQGGFQFHFGGRQNFSQIVQRQVDVNVFMLIFGGQIEIEFPNNIKKTIIIPPSTQANTRFRLKDGNIEIHIHLNPIIPTLSPEQTEKLKNILLPTPNEK